MEMAAIDSRLRACLRRLAVLRHASSDDCRSPQADRERGRGREAEGAAKHAGET